MNDAQAVSLLFQQIQQQMNFETQIKKPRLLSARISGRSSDRQSYQSRPLTGNSAQILARQELIENIYTGHSVTQPLQTSSTRALTARQASSTLNKDKSTNKVVKITKKKEEMTKEIMNLKQTVNKLVQQLSLQRGKTEKMRKKNVKYTKTFQIQVENDKFLGKSSQSHLVTGLKAMYDVLKDKYEEITAKCELLSKRQNITKETQLTTYIKILENQNKSLELKFERLNSLNVIYQTATIDQKQASEYVIGELEAQNKALNQKFRELSAQYKMRNQNLKDRNIKIAFLQKLIIQKDNSIHYTSRLAKKVQQQNVRLKASVQNEKQQIIALQVRYNNQMDEMKSSQTQLVANHNRFLVQMRNEKDARISTLEKENAYLHHMIQELRETSINISRENQFKEVTNKDVSQGFQHTRKNQYQPLSVKRQSHFVGEHEKSVSQYASKKSHNSLNGESDKIHINRPTKRRKVEQKQIAETAQLVRLRLINENISPIKLRQFFNYNSSSSNNDQNIQYHQKYITMGELRSILESRPFCLRPEDALQLARYLTEDDQSEYVFCDDQNQNLREAVKSIIKNLVKEYPLGTGKSKLREQVQKIIDQYGNMLKKTLKSLEPSGSITKKKFLDTLKTLMIDCSDQVKDLMLGIISEGAFSVNELKYDLLF